MPQDEEQYKLVEVVGTHQNIKAEILVDIQNEAEFICAYCKKSNETLRTYTVNKNSIYYRCKHKTRYQGTKDVDNCLQKQPSKRMQNTNCTFSLVIKKSNHEEYNSMIILKWNHNHSTTCLHSLTFKDISPDTKVKIKVI